MPQIPPMPELTAGWPTLRTMTCICFSTKEFIAYDIQVKHALDLFEAYEGYAPKSHEEFMEKIIKANNISLPELPEGHKYVYDPMTETLMVEKPAP